MFLDAGFDPNKLHDEDSNLPNLTTMAFAQGNYEAVDYLESIGYYLQEEVMVSMKNASGENERKLLPLEEAIEMSQRMPEELKAKQLEYLRNK